MDHWLVKTLVGCSKPASHALVGAGWDPDHLRQAGPLGTPMQGALRLQVRVRQALLVGAGA